MLYSTLLEKSVASLDHFSEKNAKWHLIIQIVPYQSTDCIESSKNNRGLFDMVACANRKVYVKIKYTTKDLKVFIDGFNGCLSTVFAKKRYLQTKGAIELSRPNPSVIHKAATTIGDYLTW